MQARYRFHGRFVSAEKAEKLSRFKKQKDFISTDITEKKAGKSFMSAQGFLTDMSLKVTYAMEKDRRIREEQRHRKLELEKQRTRDFQRKQVEPEFERRAPRRFEDYEPETGGSSFVPAYDDDEEEADYLPDLQALPDEDEMIDDYFEYAVEVADIDGDIYIEQ